jgi:regulation of enolase protein 1 (concanavalin A-like superfamily)
VRSANRNYAVPTNRALGIGFRTARTMPSSDTTSGILTKSVPDGVQNGEELVGWGQAINPDKDCTFTADEQSLGLQVPGTLHDLFFDGGPTNAPRVMREAEGSFVLTVKVSGEFKTGTKSTNPKSAPYVGAGILLWSDSNNNLRFERFCLARGNQLATGILFEERKESRKGDNQTRFQEVGDCYLRIERKGNTLLGSTSSDGKSWKALKPIEINWPTRIKVGLDAVSTSDQPFTAKFEEFELKQGP